MRRKKRVELSTSVVKHLPNTCEALGSIPSTVKKKKKEGKAQVILLLSAKILFGGGAH
jgi:hypothetical protein